MAIKGGNFNLNFPDLDLGISARRILEHTDNLKRSKEVAKIILFKHPELEIKTELQAIICESEPDEPMQA